MKELMEKINNIDLKKVKLPAIIIAGFVFLLIIIRAAMNLAPYAIVVDGENTCYVRGRDDARKAILYIVNEYTPKDTSYISFDTGGRLTFKKAALFTTGGVEKLSAEDAAQHILNTYQEQDNPIKITIASANNKVKSYTPTPNYVKAKKLLVGQSKVKKKGKKGKQEVTITYVSVNGKIKSHFVSNRKVLDEGEPATVAKGILGLPEGKDWKTYKGLPVYKNGGELITTARKYLGKPYKLGGNSLKHGIDCTHFVQSMYAKYGIDLPSSNSGLEHSGIAVPYKKARKGDIICYGNHVGIYVGKGKMINAVHRGVSVSHVKKSKIKTVRRVVK